MARMLGEQGYHVASVVGGYEAMKKNFEKLILKNSMRICNNRTADHAIHYSRKENIYGYI